MLKLKQSKRNEDEWILYNPKNFNQHTHCRHLRIALKIKYLVTHEIMPESRNERFIESCIRVANRGKYKKELIAYKRTLKTMYYEKGIKE